MVDSQGSEWMQDALRSDVGGVCFFGSSKHAEVLVLAVMLDLGHPSAISFVLCRAEQSTGKIMAWGFAYILIVLASRRFAQVIPSVVRSNTVDMVYLFLRPSVCHVKKGETVREITATVYGDADITVLPNAPGNIADVSVICGSDQTDKYAGQREVFEKYAQTRRRNIGDSHFATPFCEVVRSPRVLITRTGFAILPCRSGGKP